jgi:hypothetical protein
VPWAHCSNTAIIDTSTCPTCGVDKASWTIVLDQTRVLVIGRKKRSRPRGTLLLTLTDHREQPRAEDRYSVELPDGRAKEGQLDDKGQVSLAKLPVGRCRVRFPDHDESRFADPGSLQAFDLLEGDNERSYQLLSRLSTSTAQPPPPPRLSTSASTDPPAPRGLSTSASTDPPAPRGLSTSASTDPPAPRGLSTSASTDPPAPRGLSTSASTDPPSPRSLSTSASTDPPTPRSLTTSAEVPSAPALQPA